MRFVLPPMLYVALTFDGTRAACFRACPFVQNTMLLALATETRAVMGYLLYRRMGVRKQILLHETDKPLGARGSSK